MKLKIGHIDIISGNTYDYSDINYSIIPKIDYNFDKNKLYTIMMIDKDAPNATDPKYKYWLHWLIINNNQTIIKYEQPTPPIGSGLHRYYICIYLQTDKLTNIQISKRSNFDVRIFRHQNNLKCVDFIMFKTEKTI